MAPYDSFLFLSAVQAYHQTSVREIIIDGHDAEEAVCRANIDLFTPRDTSELVCAHLGRWTAKRMVD